MAGQELLDKARGLQDPECGVGGGGGWGLFRVQSSSLFSWEGSEFVGAGAYQVGYEAMQNWTITRIVGPKLSTEANG